MADDLNSLAVDLAQAGVRIGAVVATVVRKSTLDVQRDGQQFAPVDTGTLRSSITSEFVGDGRSGSIEGRTGPTANYGAYVEYGTARNAPAAYMGPALDRNSATFIAALEQAAGKAL